MTVLKQRKKRIEMKIFIEKSSEQGAPGENGRGDQNQKTAISSQMALTSNGFRQNIWVVTSNLDLLNVFFYYLFYIWYQHH